MKVIEIEEGGNTIKYELVRVWGGEPIRKDEEVYTLRPLPKQKANKVEEEWASGLSLDQLEAIAISAKNLYDNRLGWSDGRNPYAPPHFWEQLAHTLNGENSK